jgi:hypothetical protein
MWISTVTIAVLMLSTNASFGVKSGSGGRAMNFSLSISPTAANRRGLLIMTNQSSLVASSTFVERSDLILSGSIATRFVLASGVTVQIYDIKQVHASSVPLFPHVPHSIILQHF